MSQRITQIPLPGSSGQTPTGALQFQNDWPGLFVRGDDSISLLAGIRTLELRLYGHPDLVVAAALLKLKKFADLIERDVIVNHEGEGGCTRS